MLQSLRARPTERYALADRRSWSVHRAKALQARGARQRQKREGADQQLPTSQPASYPHAAERAVHKPNAALFRTQPAAPGEYPRGSRDCRRRSVPQRE